MEKHEAPQSLWDLVVEHVPGAEISEVRGILGDGLVDMYTEMHAEVEAWQQIWRAARSGEPRPPTPRPFLADAPAVRELLRAEVQLLLMTVRERAAGQGRDGDVAVSRYKPAVVSYALGAPGGPGAGADARRGPAASPDLHRDGSRRSSSGSSGQEEIEAMRNQLNVSGIHRVVRHLQSVLAGECEQLKNQVQILQERVEQEHRTQAVTGAPEPTVTELREERRLIRTDLERLKPPSPSPRDHGPPSCPRVAGRTPSPLTSAVASAGPRPPLCARPRPPSAPPRARGTPPHPHPPPPRHPSPPDSSGDRSPDLTAELTCLPAGRTPHPPRNFHAPLAPRNEAASTSSPGAGRPLGSPEPCRRPGTEAPPSPAVKPRPPRTPEHHASASGADGRTGRARLPPSSSSPVPPAFLPAPPAAQRPEASRGRSLAGRGRSLCAPQGDGLARGRRHVAAVLPAELHMT